MPSLASTQSDTKRQWMACCLVLFIMAFVIGNVVPPFQSPDEFDHASRVYMLGHGHLLMHAPEGRASGGKVDTGFADFMRVYRPIAGKNARKLSADEIAYGDRLAWTHAFERLEPTGTNYYFPLLYAPPAVGLRLGELLGLSVDISYRMARLGTMFGVLGLLFLAFRIYAPPPAVFAALCLPMAVYLMAAVSLDAVSTAMAIVGISAFLRCVADRETTPRWIVYALVGSVALVASSRPHFAPFLALPVLCSWLNRDRALFIATAIGALFALGWIAVMIKVTKYPVGDPHAIDHAARMGHLLSHPGDFLRMLGATLGKPQILGYYATSYIGALGWLDTSLAPGFYWALAVLGFVAIVSSVSIPALRQEWVARSLLIACALAMVVLTFLAMLVQWTMPGDDIIQGVQGRYLLIPTIAAIYAITGPPGASGRRALNWRVACIAILALVSLAATLFAVIDRYYLMPTQPVRLPPVSRAPTPVLTPERPIPLHIDAEAMATGTPVDRIDILLGTYNRVNHGTASLVLRDAAGNTNRQDFDVSTLHDNAYASFPLDGKKYTNGELVIAGGEGISAFEAHSGSETQTCIRYVSRGSVIVPRGCP